MRWLTFLLRVSECESQKVSGRVNSKLSGFYLPKLA